MKVVLSFINDWRDTIFYSVIGSITLFMLIFFDLHAAFLFVAAAQYRESARGICWVAAIRRGEKGAIAFMAIANLMSVFTNAFFLLFCMALTKYSIWVGVCFGLNFVLLFHGLHRMAPPELWKYLPRIWFKELWDYPRKQKPPAHRWRKACEKLKQLIEEMAPESPLIPQATGRIND